MLTIKDFLLIYRCWHARPEHKFWHWFVCLFVAYFSWLLVAVYSTSFISSDPSFVLTPHLAQAQIASSHLTVAASVADGVLANYQAGVPWTAVHDAVAATSVVTTATARDVNVSSFAAAGNYEIRRALFPFDTSIILGTATVTGATVKLFVILKNDSSNDGNDWYVLVSAAPGSSSSFVAGDYSQFGTTELSNRISTAGVVTGSYITFTLNTNGLAAIAKGGVTTFGLREGHDLLNIPIAVLTQDKIQVAFSEAGASQAPILDVDYTNFPSSDTTPPSTPTGLTAASNSASQITLNWSASTDNVAVTGYRLDVATDNAFTNFVSGYQNTDVGNVLTKAITGLSPSTTYYMRLRSYDAAGNTSNQSISASATTQAPPPPPYTSGQEGAGAMVATLAVLNNGALLDVPFGGTVSPYYWVTNRSFTSLDFSVAIDVAPGTGNTLQFVIKYATLSQTQNCTDIPTVNWITVNLGALSNSQKSFTVSNVPVNVVGPACIAGHMLRTASYALAHGTASLYPHDSTGDGPTYYQGTASVANTSGKFYLGNWHTIANHDRSFWLAGSAIKSVGGVLALSVPPGAGNTWHIQIAYSQTPLSPSQNCLDLAYSRTADIATITGTQKEAHWNTVPVDVPAGGCIQIQATWMGGTPISTATANYGLTVSGSNIVPYNDGGPSYSDAGSGAFDANHTFGIGHWAISDANNANLGQRYWRAPITGLAGLSGAFTFTNPTSGTGQFDIGLRTSTAAPAADQGCLDLQYIDSAPLCSMKSGEKSCSFPISVFNIPANGCFALEVKASGGTPSNTSPFNWQATGVANVSGGIPPDTTPPSTPTGLSAATISTSQITLNWSASTDNVAVTGYRLDVATDNAFTNFVSGYQNTDVGNVLTKAITGLSPSTTYYMRLRAYDVVGNTSNQSISVSATTQALPPPPPVSSSNTFTITNPSATTLTNYPVQIGRPFIQGEIPNFPQAVMNGSPIFTQADVKERWPDGSVKHSIISFILPSLNAGAAATVTFQNQTSGNNTPLTATQMLGSNFNFDAAMELTNGSTVTASARRMLQDGNFTYWTQGPIATTIILTDHSLNRTYDIGFDANRSFRPIFHATFWPTINKVRVRFIGEIANTEALQDQTYALALKTDLTTPTIVYTKPSFTHTANSRWTKEFWIGGAPSAIAINHNLSYLAATTLLPNYDTSKVVPESALSSAYSSWVNAAKDLYDAGQWQKYMPTTGGRPDIGPYPAWTVRWLYTGDARMRGQAFGNADLAAAWPMHFREGKTSKFLDRAQTVPGIGKVLSISSRPTFCFLHWPTCGNAADAIVPVGPTTAGGWIVDRAHQPDAFSAQYLLTGDYWYLEEMWFWSSWNAAYNDGVGSASDAWGRGPTGKEGNIYDQIRGDAWTLRNRVRAAVYAPEGTPEKDYFTVLTDDAIAAWEGMRNITNSPFNGNVMWNWGHARGFGGTHGVPTLHHWSQGDPALLQGLDPAVTKGGISTWEQSFMMYALGLSTELGIRSGELQSWLASEIIGQLTNSGYSPYLISAYRMPINRLSDGDFFQTWAELKTGFLSSYTADGGLAYWNANLGNADHGYSIIAIAASAMVADQPGGAAAWNWIAQHALTAPALNDNPKWAIVPRNLAPPDVVPPNSTPFDFSLTNSGNISVSQGSSVTNIITATLVNGTPASLTFSVSGLPIGATVSFSPVSCSPNCFSTLTLTTQPSAPLGPAVITITATGGGTTKATTFTLTVSDTTAPTFTTSPSASGLTPSGATISFGTSEPTTSVLDYGVTSQYGSTAQNQASAQTSHAITLTNLQSDTTYHYRVRIKDSSGNEASFLNQTFKTLLPSDTTPPSAISDLKLIAATPTSLDLSWTSTGDDASFGQALSYDLRFSTSPLSGSNFSSAARLTGLPTPKPAGNWESYTVIGLNPSTTYYLALKATDDANLASPISNILQSSTTASPPSGGGGGSSGGGGYTPDTTPPAPVAGLRIQAADKEIHLSWTNPADPDFVRTAIVRKLGTTAPTSSTDGTLVYEGTAASFTDTNLTNGQSYSYALFTLDRAGNYSAAISPSVGAITPTAGANTFNTSQVSRLSGLITADRLGGTSLSGATVTLKTSTTTLTTTTDAQGRYQITNLVPGTYTLTVAKSNHRSYTTSSFVLSAGASKNQNYYLAMLSGLIPNIPAKRDLRLEKQAIQIYVKLFKRLPKTTPDWISVNYLAYGGTVAERDLKLEKQALIRYGQIYRRLPKIANDWRIVHALGYAPLEV